MSEVSEVAGSPEAGGESEVGQLSERARRWASTMEGHRVPVAVPGGDGASGIHRVRRAHSNGPVRPVGAVPVDRRAREEREDATLAGGATRAWGAGDRAVPEDPDPLRTCFERDRDRILHSTAFRRLSGKTQVFVFPDDHQRTRLTHALEVAQVAVAVARAAGLNTALTEAIALGHDCGHGPGGHASEDALSVFLDEGFDHAVWGADVVLAPLNLTTQVLDGVRNHSWSRPAPATPEAEVVSWADRCAYTAHDLEDAERAGIVTPDMLPDTVVERCGRTRSRQLRAFVTDLVETITTTGIVGMSDEGADALAALRAFNYEHIYLRPASVAQARSVIEVLHALVECFSDRPNLIPDCGNVAAGTEEAVRQAVTYVGGMTDRYAFRCAVALLDWDTSRLPRGI